MKPARVVSTVQAGSLKLEIREYADGRFGFDHRPPGEMDRTQVRLKTQKAAEERGRELVGLALAGRVQRMEINPDEYAEFLAYKAAKRAPAMIPALVAAFLKGKESKGRSDAHIRELRSTLDKFAEAFPGPIAKLTDDGVEAWIDARNVGPRRWNNMRAAIVALHRFARGKGLLPAELTPVEKIEKHAVVTVVETYSPQELRALLAVVPIDWRPLVALGAFAGLRPEEVAPDRRGGKEGLRWENILWDKRKIDVPASVSKVRRRRFAPLTDAAASFLLGYRNTRGEIAPPTNKPQRVIAHAIFAFNAARGPSPLVVWKRNALRHSFASYRLALTKDAPALALEMGNSPAMIFEHYLDLKHEDEAAEWFDIRPGEVPQSIIEAAPPARSI